MKPLFNFTDNKFTKGFQLDMSVLSDEQREHVLKIFQARGFTVIFTPKDFNGREAYLGYGYHGLVGAKMDWDKTNFEPCDYTPESEVMDTSNNSGKVFEFADSPATEPKEISLEAFLGYIREQLAEKDKLEKQNKQLKANNTYHRGNSKRLEQENASLKEQIEKERMAAKEVIADSDCEAAMSNYWATNLKEENASLKDELKEQKRMAANLERQNAEFAELLTKKDARIAFMNWQVFSAIRKVNAEKAFESQANAIPPVKD